MRVVVHCGDILDEEVDALISTANPHLRMSGGVNGAILLRGGGSIQRELDEYLGRLKRKWVEPGTVVVTGPGPLRVGHVLHAVAIDGSYHSSVEMVRLTITAALRESERLNAETIALPALATGYGRLPMGDFAKGLVLALKQPYPTIHEIRVVVRHDEDAKLIRDELEMGHLTPLHGAP